MFENYEVSLGSLTIGCAENTQRMASRLLEPAPGIEQVRALQEQLAPLPQVECPVRHFFAPGLYTRECTIPAGSVVVGKQHRHQHPVFLMAGTVRINTDAGMETISGPHIWISPPDAKRALYTLTDCVFATVHLNPTDTQDLEAIEADVIVSEGLLTHDRTEAGPFSDELMEVFA